MKKLMMAVMVAGMAAAALADVSFSYSGQLRNETGGAVSEKTPTITFSLYRDATGGSALWARMIPVQLDDNGYFAVELSNANGSTVGTETKLEEVLANNATLYIGLNVKDSSGEIFPRQKLLSTPRAAFAEDVKTAKYGFTVNGAAVFVDGLTVGGNAEIKADGTLNAKSIKQDGNVLIPSGVIVMWSGTTPPAGWALCNGVAVKFSDGVTRVTPNLRGKFIVGYNPVDGDYNAIGRTGGSAMCTLGEANVPPHRHQYLSAGHAYDQLNNDCWHDGHKPSQFPDLFTSFSGYVSCYIKELGAVYGNEGRWEVLSTGKGNESATAHENRPPYYTLAYIIKL